MGTGRKRGDCQTSVNPLRQATKQSRIAGGTGNTAAAKSRRFRGGEAHSLAALQNSQQAVSLLVAMAVEWNPGLEELLSDPDQGIRPFNEDCINAGYGSTTAVEKVG